MSNPDLAIEQDTSLSRKRFLKGMAAAGALGVAGVALSGSAIPPVNALSGSYGIDPATYIIDNESGTFKVYDGSSGSVDNSGSDAATVINWALSHLLSGGSVFIREGSYPLKSGLNIGTSGICLKMSRGAWLTLNALITDVISVNA